MPLVFGQRLQKHDPACVHTFNQFQRPFHRCLAIGQSGEGRLIIARHLGPVFGQRLAQPVKGRHVRVAQVVHHLPHGPSPFAIRRVESLVIQAADSFAQLLRQLGNRQHGLCPLARTDTLRRNEAANRITRVWSRSHADPC